MIPPSSSFPLLRAIYRDALDAVDGATVMRRALAGGAPRGLASVTHVLAIGKAAGPMWEGLAPALPRGVRTLLVLPPRGAARLATTPGEAPAFTCLVADHPTPTPRSVAAAEAARAFVADVPPEGRLAVLLSGGSSALLAEPAPGLSLNEKVALTGALARAGAPIHALNVVRKHLSRVKGGRLAALTAAPLEVFVLADVLGGDDETLLATVGSAPFCRDASTLGEAAALLASYGVALPPSLAARWNDPAQATAFETPKEPALFAHVQATVVGRPRDLQRAAEEATRRAGCAVAPLFPGTEADVDELAAAIVARLAEAVSQRPAGATPLVMVGHGEPTLRLPAGALGQGGRASHLAWSVARLLERWPAPERSRIAFLAASSDDRDGSSPSHGALADGSTFARARAAGREPQRDGEAFDTATLFGALGDHVDGPGRSNVLDLHLAAIA